MAVWKRAFFYAWEVWERLAPMLDRIKADDPLWVREQYIDHMAAALSHDMPYRYLDKWAAVYVSVLNAASRLPEGDEFVNRHGEELGALQQEMHSLRDAADASGTPYAETSRFTELESLLDDALGPLKNEQAGFPKTTMH